MLEAIDGAVSSNLSSAQNGALTTGDLDKTNALIANQGAQIVNHLDSALGSGDQQAVQVELEALYEFFGELKTVHQQLSAAHAKVSLDSMSSTVQTVVHTVQSVFTPDIPGVQAAMMAAQDRITGQAMGLGAAFVQLQNILARNMTAVRDTYVAYLQADEEGSSALSEAARTGITSDWQDVGVVPTVSAGREYYV